MQSLFCYLDTALNCYVCHEGDPCFYGNENGNSVDCGIEATACVTVTFVFPDFDFPYALRNCYVLPNGAHDGDCDERNNAKYCYCTSDNCNGI